MFCTNCGKQVTGAGKYCSSCGAALKQDAQPAPKETVQTKPPGFKDNTNNKEVIRLAGLAMSGDDSVWGEIYERTNRYVYFMALKFLHSEQDAQDITQDVYIQAIRSIGQLYNAESFFGWLRSIVFSKCKNIVKKKSPVLLEDEAPGLLESMPEVSDRFLPDMTLDNSESKRMVLELVDALPYQQRQTILFYYYDDMTVDQISALMECPAGTVKSRLNYARQQIKAGVEEHERKGVKLYGAATLPILTMLLREQAKTLPIPSSLDSSMMPIIKSMSMPESGTSPPDGYADSANPAAPSGTHTPYGNAKPPDNYTTNPAPQVPQGYVSAPPAPGAGVASVTGNAASAVGEAVAGGVASSAAGAAASSAVATAATAISTKVIAIIVASVIAVGGGVFALTRGGGSDSDSLPRGSTPTIVADNDNRDDVQTSSSSNNERDSTRLNVIRPRIPGNNSTFSSSGYHSVVISEDGYLYTWGNNLAGQLGLGDFVDRSVPTRVPGISNVVAVSATYDISMAVTADGFLYTWGGYGGYSDLNPGHGDYSDNNDRNVPRRIPDLTDVVAVMAGYEHVGVITGNGDLYVWGNDSFGELGLGEYNRELVDDLDYYGRTIPTRVPGISNVSSIYIGDGVSAAVTNSGEVYVWGLGCRGCVNADAIDIPTRVDGITNAVSVFMDCVCSGTVLTADGDLHVWRGAQRGFETHAPAAPGEQGTTTWHPEQPSIPPTLVTEFSNVLAFTHSDTSYGLTIVTTNGNLYPYHYSYYYEQFASNMVSVVATDFFIDVDADLFDGRTRSVTLSADGNLYYRDYSSFMIRLPLDFRVMLPGASIR